jgi:predicted amidohydrolase YtcJ
MVTRKTSSGDVLYASESIEPIEAIKAYTIDGAYAAWEENIKGTIEPGKLADLVVIDKNPTKINPEDLRKIKNLMTVINGKIVYET